MNANNTRFANCTPPAPQLTELYCFFNFFIFFYKENYVRKMKTGSITRLPIVLQESGSVWCTCPRCWYRDFILTNGEHWPPVYPYADPVLERLCWPRWMWFWSKITVGGWPLWFNRVNRYFLYVTYHYVMWHWCTIYIIVVIVDCSSPLKRIIVFASRRNNNNNKKIENI